MLDVYGNLVKLCATPYMSKAQPNALTPDWAPQAGHQPHANNAATLAFMGQACLTPGTSYPIPANTCPGLAGWFTVVWNACQFTNAPGVAANVANIPNYFTPTAGNYLLTAPSYLCGNAPQNAAAPNQWYQRGPGFKGTKCRRALDQFARAASRCAPTGSLAAPGDTLRYLAAGLGAQAPICSV
jgi:hypothetical protein